MSLIHFFVDDEEVLSLLMWASLVKWRAGYVCEECGYYSGQEPREKYPVKIVAHHRNFDRRLGNHTLANGQCLCVKCHARIHRERAAA